jgi:hypothetical protein
MTNSTPTSETHAASTVEVRLRWLTLVSDLYSPTASTYGCCSWSPASCWNRQHGLLQLHLPGQLKNPEKNLEKTWKNLKKPAKS